MGQIFVLLGLGIVAVGTYLSMNENQTTVTPPKKEEIKTVEVIDPVKNVNNTTT